MKKEKRYEIFWISAAVILLLIAISMISLAWFTDSERIIKNKLRENKIEFSFNASDYPVIIDKIKYPELSIFEKSISGEYEIMLQNFAEGYGGWGYDCFLSPVVLKLNFAYLEPKQSLYLIESYCEVPGETSPFTQMPSIMFSINQGDVLMFYQKNIASHFTETFNNLENLNQAKEYSEIYIDNLIVDIDSALNNSLLYGSSPEDFYEDCPLLSEIPKLNSTISKKGDIFVYEGLKIEPEGRARLYYIKYNITSDGKVVEDSDKMLAMCQSMGIIY